jgi:SnoaL-like domain
MQQAETDLIHRYLAIWNESDAARRRALVEGAFAEGATYLDPMMAGEGQAGIDAMIAAAQARFPGLRFRLAGTPQGHNGRLRFSWELGPEGGEALAGGTDFAVLAPDGRLASVTGFIDFAPAG